MATISLRKVSLSDKRYFAKWWRDIELLKLTSGNLKLISDRQLDKYFKAILNVKKSYQFIITFKGKPIGHLSLVKKPKNWYETQIIVGEKKYWNKGYGTKAIGLLIKKAKDLGISKIYLEVRPTNLKAIKVYEKSGFKKKKIINYPNSRHLQKTVRMELQH
ncbi:MAG: hypothetical protein A3A24_01140 [Candidatus Buchananbacteria bacterium RIFCSPLOWO2_01_FULL_46_12]|uniref:N-acetyltransferase domain-containing protein n=1 Tax=Candidatus Buchananbacteria bacterium RIFCSPLOWO2_01_FULL_46_12 TaxID=1797546 RepID=A0A1G1YRU4_9BACT|nr:MAG: hypothetical protein A3A24_01140 [Candidatus Buchananbacteria bacterium RIFCSPLOWO2_01_FULL_46_12]